MSDIRVQFGTFESVFGKPAAYDSFTFLPAAIELDGDGFSTEFYLSDSIDGRMPPILAHPIKEQYDVSWVRARLPRAFGFTPEPNESEKSLLHVGFIAMPAESSVGFAFVCTDYYGRTGLMFSPNGPDRDVQAKIAMAFWSVMLQSPCDLEDFDATVYHPGAGIWMRFGCKDGVPRYEEFEENDGRQGN